MNSVFYTCFRCWVLGMDRTCKSLWMHHSLEWVVPKTRFRGFSTVVSESCPSPFPALAFCLLPRDVQIRRTSVDLEDREVPNQEGDQAVCWACACVLGMCLGSPCTGLSWTEHPLGKDSWCIYVTASFQGQELEFEPGPDPGPTAVLEQATSPRRPCL